MEAFAPRSGWSGPTAATLAGSRARAAEHAELGPWTRSGHRVVVTIPAERADHDDRVYLADPASGELTPLASGDLISVLDLSVDQDYVIIRDGQRGRQFCVVLDRRADQDYPSFPIPASGSTERAIIRPSPSERTSRWSPTSRLTPGYHGVSWWRFHWVRMAGEATRAFSARGRTPNWRAWTRTTLAGCCCWSGTSMVAASSNSSHVDRRIPCRTGRSGPGGLRGSAEP